MHSIRGLAVGITALGAGIAQAQYALDTTYDASNFFKTWDFFTGLDPTRGFVEYINGPAANTAGLAGTSSGAIFMGVDSTTENPPNGRQSVRLESQKSFTGGLFIADISHMPGSICGSWPAFWMYGNDWPNNGEIDIIEGVNAQKSVSVTLHSGEGLDVTTDGAIASTKLLEASCSSNSGCSAETTDKQSYGDGFNAVQGGVYATEWTSEYISVWFFPRSAIPADVTSLQPEPAAWGQPVARFNGNIGQHFRENHLVFDTTFCGDWAGNTEVWSSDPVCSKLAPSCHEYVAANPGAFADAYWTVNSIRVYQTNNGSDAAASSQPAPTPRAFRA